MRHPIALLLLVAVGPAFAPAAPPDSVALAAVIDARLATKWEKNKVTPAAVVDDATFLRRASLDLIGRIPTAAEVREFLADKGADKRAKLVTRLVDSGGHTRHMATFWRRTWVPQADTAEYARLTDDFEAWVSACLQENVPYDRVVRELITQPRTDRRAAVAPAGFVTANEGKPETLAASATRAFLGVNLDCAQCHDHPFARWTRNQFWQTAAFFAPPADEGGKLIAAKLTIPGTKKELAPALLDDRPVKWPQVLAADSGRVLFADWVTAADNPYFARNAVNRLWANVYGTALAEPLDDLSGDAGTTGPHVALLQELADAFTASGLDLKYLTRALVLTRAYQLATVTKDDKPTDPRLFARMPVRGLTGEQLYDSLRTAAGLPAERSDTGRGQGLDDRKRFAAQFHVERAVAAERSITQALAMMNGRLVNALTDPAKNPTLGGVAAPFLDADAKVETLFLATLGRKPSEREAKAMAGHVAGTAEADRGKALGDVFWALVNSTEFNTNH